MPIPADKVMNTTEAAEKWHVTRGEIAAWCKDGHVEGAYKTYRWLIPIDANRPVDKKLAREVVWSIIEIHNGSMYRLDLTEWGITSDKLAPYIEVLVKEGYLETDTARDCIRVTRKGLAITGRYAQSEKFELIDMGTAIIEAIVSSAVQAAIQGVCC